MIHHNYQSSIKTNENIKDKNKVQGGKNEYKEIYLLLDLVNCTNFYTLNERLEHYKP